MILSLDTATKCGWAAGRPGECPTWGARDFADKAGNGAVFGKFRAWLNQRCYELRPKIIVFEAPYIPVARQPNFRRRVDGQVVPTGGPPPMNALVLRRLLGLTAEVEAVAWELRIECREATPGEIAKFFTGRARHGGRDAKKAATVEMCRTYGWDVADDDNAADALALWAMAEALIAPELSSRRGIGPLFTATPQKRSAPRSGPREAQSESDTLNDRQSSDARQYTIT